MSRNLTNYFDDIRRFEYFKKINTPQQNRHTMVLCVIWKMLVIKQSIKNKFVLNFYLKLVC